MAPFIKHDLDRKYKKWRRGMSKKEAAAKGSSGSATSKGSLKQQLRGKERLLGRLEQQQQQEESVKNSPETLDKLRGEIRELRQEMERKQTLEKERQNAVKSHGTRFLERQRLSRTERSLKLGRGDDQGDRGDKERVMLQKLALDMVYVAFHPHDVKYQPLFRKGVRVVDDKRALLKRAKTRQRILTDLKALDDQGRRKVNWILPEHYERLPKVEEWTVELERVFFGERSTDGTSTKGGTTTGGDDDRFQLDLQEQHAAILAAADQVEAELDHDLELRTTAQERESRNEESSNDDTPLNSSASDSDDDSDSDDSTVASGQRESAPRATEKQTKGTKPTAPAQSQGKARDHTQRVSDGKSTEINRASARAMAVEGNSTKSKKRAKEHRAMDDMEEPEDAIEQDLRKSDDDDDDFLVPAFDEDINAFAKPAAKPDFLPGLSNDKSKGWETQRQRPGQFKRRKTRK